MVTWVVLIAFALFTAGLMAFTFVSMLAHDRRPRDQKAIGTVYMNPRGPEHPPWTKGARLHTTDDFGRGSYKGLV